MGGPYVCAAGDGENSTALLINWVPARWDPAHKLFTLQRFPSIFFKGFSSSWTTLWSQPHSHVFEKNFPPRKKLVLGHLIDMLVTHVAATFSARERDSWARTSHESVSVIRVDDICLGSLGSLVGNYLYGNLLTLTESQKHREQLWVTRIKSSGKWQWTWRQMLWIGIRNLWNYIRQNERENWICDQWYSNYNYGNAAQISTLANPIFCLNMALLTYSGSFWAKPHYAQCQIRF